MTYLCDTKFISKKLAFFRNFLVLFRLKSIGIPAGIGQGTGLGLRDRDRDGIGLRHYRLRTSLNIGKVHGAKSKNIACISDL